MAIADLLISGIAGGFLSTEAGGHLFPTMTSADIAIAFLQLNKGDKTSPEVKELLACLKRASEFERLREGSKNGQG